MKTSLPRSSARLVTVALILSGLALSAYAGPSPQFWTAPRPAATAVARKAAAKPAAPAPSGSSAQTCNHTCAGCGKG